VTPYRLANLYRSSGGTCCCHRQDPSSKAFLDLDTEDDDRKFLLNVDNYLPISMASYHTILLSSSTLLWEFHISHNLIPKSGQNATVMLTGDVPRYANGVSGLNPQVLHAANNFVLLIDFPKKARLLIDVA
jgi:hypothetical protein